MKAKAADRQRQVKADAAVRRAMDDPSAPPITDPVSQLQALAGRIANATDVMGERVNALERMRYESVAGSEQLRSEVAVWERMLGRLQSILVDMERLGLAERQVAIDEARVGALLAGLRWFVAQLDLPARKADRVAGLMTQMLEALAEGQVLTIEGVT